MPNILQVVTSMRLFSRELHPTKLFIYDENMVYVKRGIIKRNECTISYNHVSQVYLRRGYITSSLEIINTGGVENIEIKYLPIEDAKKAKRIIDQKIAHTHARVSGRSAHFQESSPEFEKQLARLKELKLKGMISEREFERKRKEMLESL